MSRRRLDEAQQVTGVYRCGACFRYIPLGFSHERTHDGNDCAVVRKVTR